MSLGTPNLSVQKLQKSLHVKAKAEPNYRFYSLWDKIFRKDILRLSFERCCANKGAAGIDGETFTKIKMQGVETWLGKLEEELRLKIYEPKPLLRVWIPKANGGERPLGIPCIRDRVVQMATLIVLEPIFEADFLPQQYGFRPNLDAKMAIRRVYFHTTQYNRHEIVDGDLSDYFNTIPHGPLFKSLARRIADGQVMKILKSWVEVPVMERNKQFSIRTTEAKDKHRGTCQGGVISPFMANVYFRRFLLAWKKFGHEDSLGKVVNYADDFVICCNKGNGQKAMESMREIMNKIGLTVNENKTKLVILPENKFDFLGYTFGKFYGKDGKSYLGTKPSKKSIKKVTQKIHAATTRAHGNSTEQEIVEVLNPILRGWAAYFDQGPVQQAYRKVREYTERRMVNWLAKKHKAVGKDRRKFTWAYLYQTLKLYRLPDNRADLPRAKNMKSQMKAGCVSSARPV